MLIMSLYAEHVVREAGQARLRVSDARSRVCTVRMQVRMKHAETVASEIW